MNTISRCGAKNSKCGKTGGVCAAPTRAGKKPFPFEKRDAATDKKMKIKEDSPKDKKLDAKAMGKAKTKPKTKKR